MSKHVTHVQTSKCSHVLVHTIIESQRIKKTPLTVHQESLDAASLNYLR